MNKQYRKEKFESRDEALIWCADDKPIYNKDSEFIRYSCLLDLNTITRLWQRWHKAIETVAEKRTIEVWVNVYPEIVIAYEEKEEAYRSLPKDCLGTIKLSKEITIIDGKVVDE